MSKKQSVFLILFLLCSFLVTGFTSKRWSGVIKSGSIKQKENRVSGSYDDLDGTGNKKEIIDCKAIVCKKSTRGIEKYCLI